MRYEDYTYTYTLTVDGVHCYDDGVLIVTHKPTGKQLVKKVVSVRFEFNFQKALAQAVRELKKEVDDERD